MLKALFIGGTGIISSGITKALAENADWELTILNRGKRAMEVPENVRVCLLYTSPSPRDCS